MTEEMNPMELEVEALPPLYFKLFPLLGITVSLIGLGGILGYTLGLPWLLSYSIDNTTPKIGLPSALGLVFLGVAVATVLTNPDQRSGSKWFSQIKNLSVLVPLLMGLYFIYLYLITAHFQISSLLTQNFDEMVSAFLEDFILLLSASILSVFIRQWRSESAVVYLVNVPALLILFLITFVMLGFWQNIPILFSYKLSLPAAIAYFITSIAILLGTMPFNGLLVPFISKHRSRRMMALTALVMGYGVLGMGAYDIAQFQNYLNHTANKFSTQNPDSLYVTSEFVTIVLAILVTTLLLRSIRYFDQSAFYAKEQALAKQEADLVKETERLRTNFISTLTHDLRTPLIAQKRVLEIIQNDPKVTEKSELGTLITGFSRNNDHLLKMINLLLEAYQYEDGKIHLIQEAIHLTDLTAECLSELSSLAQSRSITLLNKIPKDFPKITGDFHQLKRVFINLMGNALENIPENRKIQVSASESETVFKIQVEDNGQGISPELLPYLFERYLSGHPTRQKIGSGLGLYICKMIVDLHGGDIRVKSVLGKGTAFTILLPKLVTPHPSPPPAEGRELKKGEPT
jgi:signal transduction histidine kinase